MEALHGGLVTDSMAAFSAAVHAYLGSVTAGELGRVSDADVLAELRELEVLRRRLAVADHALIGELDRRGLAGRLAMGTTSAVLQGLLRLSPFEARDRVTAARACGTGAKPHRRTAATGPAGAGRRPGRRASSTGPAGAAG